MCIIILRVCVKVQSVKNAKANDIESVFKIMKLSLQPGPNVANELVLRSTDSSMASRYLNVSKVNAIFYT